MTDSSNNRVSLPPECIEVIIGLSPPLSSNDDESPVNNKKQKIEEDGKLNYRTMSGVTRELGSPSSSNHSCGTFQRLQSLQARVERLEQSSIEMRDEVRFIRNQTMEYMENGNRQHKARKKYMDTKFEDDCKESVDQLRTYFKAIVEEMTKTNKGLMDGLKKKWKKCAGSLKAIEDKECLRTAALDKLIEEKGNKKSR